MYLAFGGVIELSSNKLRQSYFYSPKILESSYVQNYSLPPLVGHFSK